VAEAASAQVTLLSLGRDSDHEFDAKWCDQIGQLLLQVAPVSSVCWWIGHDVKSGEIALEMSRSSGSGRNALIMHMSYDDYQYAKNPEAGAAARAVERQRKAFAHADMAFAVGPLLYVRVQGLRSSGAPCRQLIPGLSDPATELPRGRLSAITFGRFEPTEALIKQAPLAVAGFASAFKAGRDMRVAAFEDAALHVVGVPDDQVSALNKLAEKYAGRLLNVRIHNFLENRSQLRSRLEQANLSMMLSWHEGFGLTGWEAIGMGIPTIISRESGVFRLLNEIGGQATGCIQVLDVRGSSSMYKFTRSDLDELRQTILRIGMNLGKCLANADKLSRLLRTQQCYTWSATAMTLARALELPVKLSTVGPTGLDRGILEEHVNIGEGLHQSRVSGAYRLAEALVERGQYDNALATLDDVSRVPSSAALRLNVSLLKGEALLRLNRYSEAQRLVHDLFEGPDPLVDGCERIRAESILNTIYRDQGSYERAIDVGRHIVEMAESSCPREIAGAKRRLARALALKGMWQEALKEATESLLLAKADRNALGEAKALLAVGEAYRHGFNQVEAIRAYTDSRNLAGKVGHVDCYLWAALGLADSLFLVGEVEESLASLRRLETFVQNSDQGYPLESLHISLSRLVIEMFEDVDVDDRLDDLVARYETLGVQWPRTYVMRLRLGDRSLPKNF
jgi:tetratricopeptide (TPR) repeat protein